MAEYAIWSSMKQRCYDPNAISYPRYGARGVTVCAEWRESFLAFLKDMGKRPSPRHSIDRIDGSKGYAPENCRWATPYEQSDNKTRTHKVKFKGKLRTFREIAKFTGIDQSTVAYRWYNKLPLDAKLYGPAKGRLPWNTGRTLVDRSKVCEFCGQVFQYKRKSDRFCDTSCSAKWRVKNHPHTVQRDRDPETNQFKQGILKKEPQDNE